MTNDIPAPVSTETSETVIEQPKPLTPKEQRHLALSNGFHFGANAPNAMHLPLQRSSKR